LIFITVAYFSLPSLSFLVDKRLFLPPLLRCHNVERFAADDQGQGLTDVTKFIQPVKKFPVSVHVLLT